VLTRHSLKSLKTWKSSLYKERRDCNVSRINKRMMNLTRYVASVTEDDDGLGSVYR